jgi:hypothetical protein
MNIHEHQLFGENQGMKSLGHTRMRLILAEFVGICGHDVIICNNDVMHKLEFVSDTSTACFAKGWYGSFHGIVPMPKC